MYYLTWNCISIFIGHGAIIVLVITTVKACNLISLLNVWQFNGTMLFGRVNFELLNENDIST